MDRSDLSANRRVRDLLRDAEARGRVRRWPASGRYVPVADRPLDVGERGDVETVAALLTGLRARYHECA